MLHPFHHNLSFNATRALHKDQIACECFANQYITRFFRTGRKNRGGRAHSGFAGAGNDYAMSRYQTEVRRLYDVLNKRLGESAYLGGNEYTVADIATFPWTRNYAFQNVKLEGVPNVKRWFDAISARPAVQRALAKVDAIPTARDTAAPQALDRLFGRGEYARA